MYCQTSTGMLLTFICSVAAVGSENIEWDIPINRETDWTYLTLPKV